MCGIAGLLCSERFRSHVHEVEEMLAALGHRGPDDHGIVYSRIALGPCAISFYLALGATRLSLLDEVGGAQPFRGCQGGCLAFNAEIFNWPKLRSDLIASSHNLRTRCDTEVVAQLLERDGKAAVANLDGMFALAFFDTRHLLLAMG
jgi:asparagine synthase (glutamine-hydrolysing)